MKNKFKNLLNYTLLAILIIPCAFFLTGCGEEDESLSLAGSTYGYNHITASWADDITEDQKEELLAGEDEIYGTDDDIAEETFFSNIEGDSSIVRGEYTLSLEFSPKTNRVFLITEGSYYADIVNNSYTYDINNDQFTIGDTTYTISESEITDGINTYDVSSYNDYEQFSIGSTTYIIRESKVINNEHVYEINEYDQFYLNSSPYVVMKNGNDLSIQSESNYDLTYPVTNGQFTIGEETYTVREEFDNDSEIAYYSFNEDKNTLEIYEDSTMTKPMTFTNNTEISFLIDDSVLHFVIEQSGVVINMTFSRM